jgi:aryl-alcohol dehydrogenase-like predicted oxidoreductase
MEAMGDVPGEPDDPFLTAFGFVLAQPEVDTIIVGSHNPDHIRDNVRALSHKLPIPAETVEELQRRFDRLDDGWPGLT